MAIYFKGKITGKENEKRREERGERREERDREGKRDKPIISCLILVGSLPECPQ